MENGRRSFTSTAGNEDVLLHIPEPNTSLISSLSLSPLGLSVSFLLGDIHLNQVLTTSSLRMDSETPWRPDNHFFFLNNILAVS